MKHERQGILVFFATLCLSLVVLGAVFLGLTLWVKSGGGAAEAGVPQSDVPYYEPSAEESLGFVLLACPGAADPPALAAAFLYDAPAATLSAVILPPETLVLQNGRSDTIAGHYGYEGVRGGVNAVRALLDAELLRYFRTQTTGLSNLADFLGGVSAELPEDVTRSGEKFLAGEQLLDGRRMAAFLFDTDAEDGHTDTKLQAELLDKLLTGGFSPEMAPRCEKLTGLLFYNCETNLSQYDLTSRTEGFARAVEEGRLTVDVRPLEGEYSRNGKRFFPSESSLASARGIFPREDGEEAPISSP